MKPYSAKQELIKTFFDFLEVNHYTKISVTELIAEVGCSRTTFYRHYTDIIDMYHKICESVVEKVVSDLCSSFFSQRSFSPDEKFDVFCEKLNSQKKYISLLCGKNGDRTFFEIGIKKTFSAVSTFKPSSNDKEIFILKFVILSLVASYVKSLIDEEKFDEYNLKIYKNLLANFEKEGVPFE